MEERRSVLGAAHLTPLSQKALQRESALRKGGRAGGTVKHAKPLYDVCDQLSCWAVRVHA